MPWSIVPGNDQFDEIEQRHRADELQPDPPGPFVLDRRQGGRKVVLARLVDEQGQVRGMIDRLRLGDDVLPDSSAKRSIAPLLRDLAGYWGISAGLDETSANVNIPGWLRHELRQLLREAVANAVRHGSATTLTIVIAEEAGMLDLTIADNGTGFPEAGPNLRPRSISERIAGLGGTLTIDSTEKGASLRFGVPLERR